VSKHPGSDYRPDIDGLRAIAVLAVVAYHAFPGHLSGGYIGVDVFFVISGYLISSILLRDIVTGQFSILKFYSRRVRRIFPALFVVLLSCAIFGWVRLSGEEYQALGKHIAAGAGFVSNLVLWTESGYFDASAETKPLIHLWSLGVEEQFYLFWPILLYLFAMRRRLLPLAFGCVILGSFIVNVHEIRTDPVAAFYSPLSRFWELIVGATIALIDLRPDTRLGRIAGGILGAGNGLGRQLASLIAGALIIGSCLFLTASFAFPGWWALLPVSGAALAILAGPGAWFNKLVLSQRYAVAVGLISYPFYLWHWPLLSLSLTLAPGHPAWWVRAACVVLAFVLAAITYQFVEKPVRFRWSPRTAVTALLAGVGALGIFSGVALATAGLPNRPVARAFAEPERLRREDEQLRQQYHSQTQHCGSQTWVVGTAKLECTSFQFDAPGKRIVIWGDSHAAAWAPVFLQIAREHQDSVVEFSVTGCPPLLHVRKTDNDGEHFCDQFGMPEDVVASIHNYHPDLTVVVARWDMYASGWRRDGKLQESYTHFLTSMPSGNATQETSQQALLESFPKTIDALLAATTGQILILRTPPLLPHNIYPDEVRFPQTLLQPRSEHEQREAFVKNLLAQRADVPRVRVFDPADFFCPTDCVALIDGTPMYSDDNHISALGSLKFEQAMSAFVRP
jgi:peptidoglycan/LPS O-acetylase OafA/YrhL